MAGGPSRSPGWTRGRASSTNSLKRTEGLVEKEGSGGRNRGCAEMLGAANSSRRNRRNLLMAQALSPGYRDIETILPGGRCPQDHRKSSSGCSTRALPGAPRRAKYARVSNRRGAEEALEGQGNAQELSPMPRKAERRARGRRWSPSRGRRVGKGGGRETAPTGLPEGLAARGVEALPALECAFRLNCGEMIKEQHPSQAAHHRAHIRENGSTAEAPRRRVDRQGEEFLPR
jgi:hypothetical protein